jgi:hypothetical protein
VGVGCTCQGLPNSPDAICFDKNIGAFKSHVRRVEYVSTMHQERHWISSTRDCHACLWEIKSFPPCSMPQILQYATVCSAVGTIFDRALLLASSSSLML